MSSPETTASFYAGCRHVQIVENIDRRTFEEKYGFNSTPVLIRGVMDNWIAREKWTNEYMRSRFRNIVQKAERVRNGKKEAREFTIDEYIDYIEDCPDEVPFYLINCQIHLDTELEGHYRAPDLFPCWYRDFPTGKEKYRLSWLFIGAAGTYAGLHLDKWDTSAWNAMISGSKLWLFYDSSQTEYLYNGKVDPFALNNDLYPEFAHTNPIVCEQHPGEIVFTPSGWWHTVKNIRPGISITENFINETNYQNVLNCFRRNNSLKAAASMEEIVRQHLPLTTRTGNP